MNKLFVFLLIIFSVLIFQSQVFFSDVKIFELNGQEIKVTHHVDPHFYGIYEGSKEGYLRLNADGTGEYLYDDLSVFPGNCRKDIIPFEWGFFLDEDNEVVRFKRDYGYSFPVIYKCQEGACFQGCRKLYLVDYILDKKDGRLIVSSSDDWIKNIE